jgi:hypothetical protein
MIIKLVHGLKLASSTCFNFEQVFHVIHPGSGSDSTGGTVGIGTKFERNYEAYSLIP